ncbi:zinc finger protein 583-like isoform X3 [Rhopalosiphum maidis]|uniref:zinc finger protein 583-like isoform X3 n=1 Tax=Rhopalosiphum maidis TaxID=43146 RepID=UPI000EFEEB70|nr:zinc finger protein 583-like isoform X3 [Rhopalosiphum maidis]
METNHPVSTTRVDAMDNIKHDRSVNHGSLINNISHMPTFGLPASAYELNSSARLTIRFDREMFNSSLFESEIEISPAFRFNRNDLFRPPHFDFSHRSNTLLNGQFSTPKELVQNLDTKKHLHEFGLKKAEVKAKLFKCDVCKKSFSSSGGLTVHYRTHTGDKPFKCHVCNKEYSCANGILYHQRTHHFLQDTKPLKCDVCDKLFSSIGGLTVHYRSHTGDRPFKCDVCFKTFTSSSHCKYHQKTHSQLIAKKTLKCDVCNKLFSSSGGLVVHYRMHTGDRPFKCEVCFKSFTSSSHFKYHQKSHVISNDKKTLKCDVCDKLFSSAGGLVVHYRTHTGHRPFKCDICLKSFTSSSHFKYHQKTHMVNV